MERRTSAVGAGRPSLGAARVAGAENASGNAGGSSRAQTDGRKSIGGRASLAPNGRSSLAPNGRNSLAPNGRTSLAPAAAPAPMRDPRPVRERAYQVEAVRRLLEFLGRAGYPHAISPKILGAPSAKDFQQIFRFVYAHIDAGHDFGKKFEDEVPAAMRAIRYPFAGDISRSQLYAVGTMHAWPGLLAMLEWMVELVEAASLVSDAGLGDATRENPAGQSEASPERLFFSYLTSAYAAFLGGADDFGPQKAALASAFAAQRDASAAEAARVSASLSEAERALAALEADAGPLARARHEAGVYAGDVDKFSKFISHLREKRARLLEALSSAEGELATAERELSIAESEKRELANQSAALCVSADEIDRMISERDALARTLEGLAAGREDAQRLFWEREVAVQKRADGVERLGTEYARHAEALAVLPAEAANAHGADLELRLSLDAARPEAVLGADMRGVVHPTLQRLQDDVHGAVRDAQDAAASAAEALERVRDACAERAEAVSLAEARLERVLAAYLEERDAAAAEGARLESEAQGIADAVSRLRAETASQALSSQQRLQRAALEHDALVAAVASDRERVGAELFSVLDVLLSGKTAIESSLHDLHASLSRELSES